jgi:hypothetical protein
MLFALGGVWRADEYLKNFMVELTPLAYKWVAVAAMLAEMNFCSDRLNLPIKHPIDQGDIGTGVVFPRGQSIGIEGRLDSDDYMFSFVGAGRLSLIVRLHMWDGASLHDLHEKLALVRTIVDTNGAYQIARNGLVAIDVDVERLERENPVRVEQRSFYSVDGGQTHLVSLPLIDVKWGDWARPAVSAVVAGNSGDLLALQQLDDSYSRRPQELLRDVDALLAISDEEFLKFTPEQRTNLLTRFLVVKYPPPKHLPARPILPYVGVTSTNKAVPQQLTVPPTAPSRKSQ